jgi:hypothetical protein
MSLCISTFPNSDEIIVAADTRKSIKIEGKSYILDDNTNKLYLVHEKLVFMCGMYDLCYAIILAFKNQGNGTIEKLRDIAIKYTDEYLESNGLQTAKNLFLCNLLVFRFDKDRNSPMVTNFHSDDNFELREFGRYGLWCHGTSCDVATDYIKKNMQKQPLNALFYNTYRKVACETIGGYMTVYRVDQKGINLIDRRQIPDSKKFTRIEALKNSFLFKNSPLAELNAGENVIMGPNASILWSQIANPPTIPDPVVLPSYIKSTYIDSITVQSPTIVGGTITGGVLRTADTTEKRIEINTTGIASYDGSVKSGFCTESGVFSEGAIKIYHLGGTAMSMYWNGLGYGSLSSGGHLYIENGGGAYKTVFTGTVDFTNATVLGLTTTATFG